MNYNQIKALSADEFKRYCGVYPNVFDYMIIVIYQFLRARPKPGAPPKLSLADQLLVLLQYYREYRTFFHIAQEWGISETTVSRIVHRLEDILIKSGMFSLPKKQEVVQGTAELVVVDVSEQEIERPKKTEAPLQR